MRKGILFILLCCVSLVTLAQDNAKQEKVHSLLSEGIKLSDKGEHKEALEKYDAALEIDDRFAISYYEKALTLTVMQKRDEAKSTLETSLQKCPEGEMLSANYMLLADIVDMEGDSRKAIAYYNKAYELCNPDDYDQLGFILYNTGVACNNMSLLEPDSCKEYESMAVFCFENALHFLPTHASSYLGEYEKLMGMHGYACCLGVMGWFGFLGKGHNAIAELTEMPKKWAEIDLTQEEIDELGPITRATFESVREVTKQSPSDYGVIYDVFKNALPKLLDGEHADPIPLCVTEDMYDEFLWPLYAKMVREGLLEAFCHVVAANVETGSTANQDWIKNNEEAVGKLKQTLVDGHYFDTTALTEKQYGKVPSVDAVNSADEAHILNNEAALACKYYIFHSVEAEGIDKVTKFLVSWAASSPDVSIIIGGGEEKWAADKKAGFYLIAYLASSSLYLLSNNVKEMTEDGYLSAMDTVVRYYNYNKEKAGSVAELDRLQNLLETDKEAFDEEMRNNFKKNAKE